MNRIAARPQPLIREVPLSRLALVPENVRKTPADPVAEAEIKASIAAHGLLENLVARPEGDDAEGAGRYAVIAGGRRGFAARAGHAGRAGGDGGSFELSFEARRRESANDDTPPEHEVGLRLTARW